MRVGFVGAGLMGAPMVRRLVEAGHDVTVSSRDPARLAGTGWRVVGSPAEAADGAEVVCSIVPDGPEVTAVVGSVLKSAAPATVIVEMSTISPTTARELAARCAEAGVDYLDCPVSGGPPGAEGGTLAIWVGGSAEALERARPVLEVIGRADRIRHCGAVGAGLAVKLANNFLGAVNAAASAEALALARDAGVDPALAVEAVSDGTGANWQLANLFPRKVLQGDFEPGFRITHMAKDLRIAAEVAGELGLDAPMLALARQRLDEARAQFGDDRDYGAVARLAGW
ncbi:MAG: 3-hydroxyisobutyrate dehydrogenase [Actinomycetota bacterium]|nr:3-hydroxyisobutyrate dehydrogenase [Actinomycetota bacterium]